MANESNKLKVEICLGTTCYVLGSFRLSTLEEMLGPELRDQVEITGSACLNLCRERSYGNAPFVKVGDRIIDKATVEKVVEAIQEILPAGGSHE